MQGDYCQESGRIGTLAHEANCAVTDLREIVEEWDHWLGLYRRSDLENYVNGDIKFAFEQMKCAGNKLPNGIGRRAIAPVESSRPSLDGYGFNRGEWPIGDMFFQNIIGNRCVTYRRDEQLMLIQDVKFMHRIEKVVPSRFFVGFEAIHCADESAPQACGVSVFKGFSKAFSVLREGKLNLLKLIFASAMGTDDLPIRMIEGRTKIVDCISGDKGGLLCDGFVAFDRQEAFMGFCVCFEREEERSLFAENFTKFADVFRCPVHLERGTILHV